MKLRLLAPAIALLLPLAASAASYYLSPTGNNAAPGDASTPWRSFAHAFSRMAAGDTLVLLDGTYSNATGTGYINYNDGSNPLCAQPPSGADLAHPTTVRALNPGQVTVDGGSRNGLWLGRSTRKDSFILIRGITFEGGGSFFNTSFVTVKDCGFHIAQPANEAEIFSIGTGDHENGNSYNLVEDCWIWGRARVSASNYRADYNIWRRVVVRSDGSYASGSGNPNVGLTVYESQGCSVQNAIVLDRVLDQGYPYASFASAQHTEGAHRLGNNSWLGCIALKSPDCGYYFEADETLPNAPTVIMRNCVSWDSADDGINIQGATMRNLDLANLTSGLTRNSGTTARFIEVSGGTLRNAILTRSSRFGLATDGLDVRSHIDIFDTAEDEVYGPSVSPGYLTLNPLLAALRYPVRIETGTPLKGTGYGGADYGANVLKRYGVDGSRYGETGYDTLGTTNLWPWPNEDRIKTEMARASTRGFCAAGRRLDGVNPLTLTSYVWEILGNRMPDDVYAPPSQTYATWRAANFFGADLTNDAVSGPGADPDACGLTNFARYAFALPARGPVANPVTLGTAAVDGAQHLTLTFPRRAEATGLTYALESSPDLVTWTAIPGRTYTAGSGLITAQDSVAMDTAPRRFLRLHLTTAP